MVLLAAVHNCTGGYLHYSLDEAAGWLMVFFQMCRYDFFCHKKGSFKYIEKYKKGLLHQRKHRYNQDNLITAVIANEEID